MSTPELKELLEDEPEYFGCAFAAPWFGASYPDSYCIEGYLHDADGDGYVLDDHTNPCPRCNTRVYLEQQFEEGQSTESMSWGSGGAMVTVTGDEIWEIAQRWARQENPAEADAIIALLNQEARKET